MPKKTFTPEQIVPKLRQIEVLIGQGKTWLQIIGICSCLPRTSPRLLKIEILRQVFWWIQPRLPVVW